MPRVRQRFFGMLLVATLAIMAQASSTHLPDPSVDPPDQIERVLDSHDLPQDDHHAEPTEFRHRHAPSTSAPKRALHERAPPVPFSCTIVAVGNLHGDAKAAMNAFRISGVVGSDGKWSGNVDYLVQTGDIIDRGVDTRELYRIMDRLRAEANQAGGKVVSLLGNHEYMNVLPVWDKEDVWPEEIDTFRSKNHRWTELSVGDIGTSWRRNYHIACRLPLHPSVGRLNKDFNGDTTSPLAFAAISFVHGGLPPELPQLTPFPSLINNLGRSALRTLQLGRHPEVQVLLDGVDEGIRYEHILTKAENQVVGFEGPLWYTKWAKGSDEDVCAEVDAVLEKTGTRRMVMGHSRQHQGILSRCNGKIIVIDTGISGFYADKGGVISALRITYTLTPRPESVGRTGPPVWDAREVVTAVYDGREDLITTHEDVVTGDFNA